MSKWTLRIKDPQIWKDFTNSRMDNVMYIMRVLLVFKTLFFMSNVLGLFGDRLANVPRFCISMVSFLLLAVPYLLTLTTKKIVFMKWAPLLVVLFHSIADNYLVYWLFSEEGMSEGKEQFGDDHAKKLSQLVITLRSNILTSFAIGVTLMNTEWFTNTLS